MVATPKCKGDSLGDSSSHSAVKRTRMGDLRYSQSSGGQLKATPVFDPSKHVPAPLIPLSESAWLIPGRVSARVQTQPLRGSSQSCSSQARPPLARTDTSSMFHSAVPDPKGAEPLMKHIFDRFDEIHDKQIALLPILVTLLDKYIENQNLAEHLAKKEEQCIRQEAVIRQQCCKLWS